METKLPCQWCVDGLQFVLALHGEKAGTAFGQPCFCAKGIHQREAIEFARQEEKEGKGTTVSLEELAKRFGVSQSWLEDRTGYYRRAQIASLQIQLDRLQKGDG